MKKLKMDELEFYTTERVKTEAWLKNPDTIKPTYLPK